MLFFKRRKLGYAQLREQAKKNPTVWLFADYSPYRPDVALCFKRRCSGARAFCRNWVTRHEWSRIEIHKLRPRWEKDGSVIPVQLPW